ncbi:MAG: host-nuclease inhibitor Gam family protein [Alysiella sp.]|uniref:host-nuclease inhibitor Gam family protein n=1 Tax=Alysiella sp. TaxID=1872483 RepID=UPI0026DBA883|nr:host-nuclease inhibitor Gam family protein [Alysiella sp.]MDO4434713.1 host-nuclease inhibitor Gam family protein [Alysiella sp.]
MTKSKTKTQAVIGCQSRDEAVEAIKRIGDLVRDKDRVQAALNDQVAELQKQADEAVAPLTAEIEQLEEAVKVWATAHRDALTDNGKVKFADLTTGIIRWRNNPPKCTVSGVDAVLALLENNPIFERFIRVKKEVNKEAVLNEPEFFTAHPVAGLKIVQGKEFFVIEPHNQELS